MRVKATYRNIWSISYPIMLGSLATTILNLTDTAFLARVGETELGAMAIAGVFYFVMVMVGFAFGTGAQIIISRRAGEGNTAEIGRLFDQSFIIQLLLAFFVFVLLKFITPFLFSFLLSSDNVLKACNDFMGIRCYGILFALTGIAFRSFYIGISHTRIITYAALIMMGLNVILDYVLIFGKYGFPVMGIKGAALASVISELAATLYLIIYSAFRHEFTHFNLFRFTNLTRSRFNSILSLSLPVVMQNSVSMGAWFLFFVFIEHMGEHELAISNIVRATYMIIMTPMWGYASATNSMVSNLIGQNQNEQVKKVVRKIINMSMATTFIIFIATLFPPAWLLTITTSDQGLISDALGSYYITIGAMFIFSASIILLSAVSGTGNTRAAMVIEIVNILVYVIYVYICSVKLNASIEVVWASEIIYWLLMGLFSFGYLRHTKWSHLKI